MTGTQGSHFWLMVIQAAQSGGNHNISSFSGTTTPEPGATRWDMHQKIRVEVENQYPAVRGGVVTSFDIQPNKL